MNNNNNKNQMVPSLTLNIATLMCNAATLRTSQIL